MFTKKALPRHIGPNAGQFGRGGLKFHWPTSLLRECLDSLGDLGVESVDSGVVVDLVRRTERHPGDRMGPGAEQVLHLLRCDCVAVIETVNADEPGPDPAARRLALRRVVVSEPDATLLGRVERSDLLGQVLVPRSRRELVKRHGHIPKGRPRIASGPVSYTHLRAH